MDQTVYKNYNMITIILVLRYLVLSQLNYAQENIVSSEIITPSNSDSGVIISAYLIGDFFANLSGAPNHEGSYMTNALLQVEFDLNKLFGVDGMSIYTSVMGIKGEPFLKNAAAIQGISNISGENHWKLYETWIEQKFLKEKFSLLLGLYDLNSEFDVREASDIFINPSFGIGFDFSQSGMNGPSVFPYTSLAIRLKAKLSDTFEIIGAVFDGVPGSIDNERSFQIKLSAEEGALIATELIYSAKDDQTRSSIGGWYYTSNFETIPDASRENGNFGFYANFEKMIYTEESNHSQGISFFGRIGLAHSNFNPSDYSVLSGMKYTGLIPGRDEDIFGLAFTSIHFSNNFKNAFGIQSTFETIWELTYSFQALSWVRIQPDIQYIINPVFAQNIKSVFVGGMRAEITF